MGWIESIDNAIRIIEENINKDITLEEIARQVCISSFYFQKGFAMLCGYSLGEYIRNRRLSTAGEELLSSNKKIIDIALEYGWESPDSFTKAFTRFHGVTPIAVRREGTMIKSFAPLRIKFSLEGGLIMDYKVVEKEGFTVIGFSKEFGYDSAFAEIPKYWEEHFKTGKGEIICGIFGVCYNENKTDSSFQYMIADNYLPWKEIPKDCTSLSIPKQTWAVFPCKGPMPGSLQDTNKKIFSEWLPNCKEYEIASDYNIELYSNSNDYPKGTLDENYYSEIWIPVKKK